MADDTTRPLKRRRPDRVIAACDLCKRRKVKCDGEQPCGYCTRKHRAETCTFTAPKQRGLPRSSVSTPAEPSRLRDVETAGDLRRASTPENGHHEVPSSSPAANSKDDNHEDTAVPLEGRILRDARGQVIFIGDCAPLSFLQTVRHLIAAEADPEGFAVPASRDSIIEVALPSSTQTPNSLAVDPRDVQALVDAYSVATSGLVDLFERDTLCNEIKMWANGLTGHADEATAAVLYLVLAIGAQERDETQAEAWFKHARDILLKHLCNGMNVSTVQGFALVAVFMLRAYQPNGAYLYFSLAARTAYAIGIHRTEVNASFGEQTKAMRDRVWKSLRVIDILISNVLGRPTSTSDVDCTVKYNVAKTNNDLAVQMLSASVQIFMIVERVVVEVYSRKRISLRIASYVSRQLKGWASNWLQPLSDTIHHLIPDDSAEVLVGSCSTLCSYFYGIMLLTRPFLIYDLYEHMGASLKGGGTHVEHQEKRRYADAALEAAASFVETLRAAIQTNRMPRRMPLIVAWLFPASLVLAASILGRFGLTFEKDCEASIRCLDYFGQLDPHAKQYSLITQSLLKTTTSHHMKREQQSRSQRRQASAKLFGLICSNPPTPAQEPEAGTPDASAAPSVHATAQHGNPAAWNVSDWTIYDADFFALPWHNENDQGLQDFLQPGTHPVDGAAVADIPLFPMYDQQMRGGFM
ncbi:hypothetical protein M011DRAFT_406552 [Sporormia fimetaria CBS 119925]|uniref:Zn(2)-C6 fungal-type domain-containing protein n=1 Tax=Sporormia fimetaria CBS 119925 TaxID=1340428 RepID=A0A6A6V4E6_9PLEO|nr:hypothetical protein M011DRAFT_406552 [Sporormia fimetaria CBS 119925]